jgi:type VI secretion system secreted protein VgrG
MADYKQQDRPFKITTPLGPDQLLIVKLHGHESISHLFSFHAELLAENDTEIQFDNLIGKNVTVQMRLPNDQTRYFNGIVKSFSQGARDEVFTAYRAEIVPKPWLLTRKIRSRIFQHISTADILKQVLAGIDVTYELLKTYYPRDYCVQYRESDFEFVSRLMEEEGIYYFFKHSDGQHQMVVTDAGNKHPTVPGQSSVVYEELTGDLREEMRIHVWEKTQELRSSKYTLWDHCFELPGKHLEETAKTVDSVKAGKVTHKLNLSPDPLEIYDFPGGYAKRFDGIDRGGGPRPGDIQHISDDGVRTIRLRMEEEDCATLKIAGAGDCGNFSAGHKFTLEHHFNADGDYLLTSVEHDAHQSGYRATEQDEFKYRNTFACMPVDLPYRPRRITPKPAISGIQTATVTGPSGQDTSGQEIFCDKYGRVKVQFHWDREGKLDGDSSCWVRVSQLWAGKGWGSFFWPRYGHEVVVAFEEGDPDQPVIVGSVYNAANMPPYTLPDNNQIGGIRSASVRGNSSQNFNGVIFNDENGAEHLSIHSEHNMSLNSEYDKMFHAGRHKGERVSGANIHTVGNLPGGGGSGGGGNFDDGNTMPHPPPLGIVGLNSQMIYGENLQATTGLNFTMGVGNVIQLCINPLGLAAAVSSIPMPGVLTSLLGSGIGGNVQMTIGANTSITLGPAYNIKCGGTALDLDLNTNDDPVTKWACAILGGVCVLWVILYGAITTDVDRAKLAITFQVLVEVALAAIVALAWAHHNGDRTFTAIMKNLFKPAATLTGKQWAAVAGLSIAAVALMSEPIWTLAEA